MGSLQPSSRFSSGAHAPVAITTASAGKSPFVVVTADTLSPALVKPVISQFGTNVPPSFSTAARQPAIRTSGRSCASDL